MPTIGSNATITGEGRSTAERAHRLYVEIIADIHSKGIKPRPTTHGTGYLWNGNLNSLASRCWPDLTITEGRTGPATKRLLDVIKRHLKDTKNVIWVQERGQFYVSPEYKEARVAGSKQRKTSPAVAANLGQESITERAKRIWARAHAFCELNNYPTEAFGGVAFFVCDKPLAYFVKAEYPELSLPAMQTEPAFEKYRRPFYDLLRATTNAVNIGSKYFEEMRDGEHKWLIRKEWHDSHEAFEAIFQDIPVPAPAAEPAPPEAEPELTVESVEQVVEHPKDLPPTTVDITPEQALAVLTDLVSSSEHFVTEMTTENEMLKAHNDDLKAENDTLKELVANVVDGQVILDMLDEVLTGIYEGKIGMSRALADVEDIVKQAKEDRTDQEDKN